MRHVGTDRFLPLLAAMSNSGRALSLAEAATVAHMSPWHLQRAFAAAVGESPARYQQRLRLERSALVLRSTDERIIDIALTAGFASHEAFTRAFRSHFGVAPAPYRRQASPVSVDRATDIVSSGRCVGLHHLSTESTLPKTPHRDKDKTMSEPTSPEIRTETIDEVATIVGRRRVDRDHLAEAFAEILPAAFGVAMERGLTMVGPPFVRYVSESAAFVEIEAGVPVVAAGDIDVPDLFVSSLPGGLTATTIHQGSYDTLGETHVTLDRWIHEHGHTATGGPWEIYLTDPAEVPNPDDWKTQIVWPLAS